MCISSRINLSRIISCRKKHPFETNLTKHWRFFSHRRTTLHINYCFLIFQVYIAEDVKRELGLHREELVALAFFLGCDYSEGVTGVGIVNALEIVQVGSVSLFLLLLF